MTRITFAAGRAAQPEALARIAVRVAPSLPLVRRPLFCGIGASFAALAVPVELLRARGIPAQRILASEFVEHPNGFDTDALIGVSQGGRSSETLDAFAHNGFTRVAVVNVAPSPLTELADSCVYLGGEPDSYASTVGFTGTIIALDRIAASIAGQPPDGTWDDIADLVTATQAEAAAALALLIPRAATCVAVDVVASGASRASAEETALLLREVPRVPAAASATRNYLHGEMESAGNTLHVVYGAGREVELARTLSAAGHPTLLVTPRAVDTGRDLYVVRLPETATAVRVVLETLVAQELVAGLADERGVPVESFVFANHDTKLGGVDPADFS